MLVMAFDIATSTGVALGRPGSAPRTTTVNLGGGKSEAMKFAKAIAMTRELVGKYRPDLVVYEAPVAGPKTSHFLVGAAACVLGQVCDLGVRCEQVHMAAVRKHFVGRNLRIADFPGKSPTAAKKAMKQVVIDRCYLLGWQVRTDDEADAVACWDYACATYARAQVAPAGGLFRG